MATRDLITTRELLMDPEEVRKTYNEMPTSTLCVLLVALGQDAGRTDHDGDAAGLAFCIDRAAIVCDVLSGRLPDVGTEWPKAIPYRAGD